MVVVASAGIGVAVVDGEDDHSRDQDSPEVVVAGAVHKNTSLICGESNSSLIDILCSRGNRCENQSRVRRTARRPLEKERLAIGEQSSLLTPRG